MICPVCEHAQEFGVECEVCGKDLGGLGELGAPPSAAQVVEGLEATIGERVGDIAIERVGELEHSTFNTANVTVIEMDDLERTENEAVGAVVPERVTDFESDRVADDGVRTAAPTGQVVCRYCRNVQAEGLMCEKCGMKLPKVVVPVVTATPLAQGKAGESVRCRACGAPGKSGQKCTECGRDLPLVAN